MEQAMPFLDPKQTVADLRAGAQVLRDNWWNIGADYNPGPGGAKYFCAFGAIRYAVGDMIIGDGDHRFSCTKATQERASNAARAFYRAQGKDIVTINDSPSSTKEQMIDLLEHTADELEKDPRRA
jgi:hypothetical protein